MGFNVFTPGFVLDLMCRLKTKDDKDDVQTQLRIAATHEDEIIFIFSAFTTTAGGASETAEIETAAIETAAIEAAIATAFFNRN